MSYYDIIMRNAVSDNILKLCWWTWVPVQFKKRIMQNEKVSTWGKSVKSTPRRWCEQLGYVFLLP